MATQPVNVDDYDTNAIDYQNPSLWIHDLGQQNVQGGTYTAGFTNAVAKFAFNGTEVVVFGVANPSPAKNTTSIAPSISFSIDGGTPNIVSSPPVKTPEYSHQFFDSHNLSAGLHTLQILVNNGEQDWPFALDYIQYTPLVPSASSTTSQPTSTSVSASPSPTSSTAPATSSRAPVGAIVGGVIGGLIGLGLIVFALWFYLFRYKKHGTYHYHAATKVDLLEEEPKAHVVPFIAPSTTAFDSSYASNEHPAPHHPSYDPSYAPDSIYAPTAPDTHRTASYNPSSRPSSPKLGYTHTRPATPPAVMHRPGTPPAMFAALGSVPVVPSPLGKAMAGADADAVSVRSIFHADSGIRFVPVPVRAPTPAPALGEGAHALEDILSDAGVSEVPPEYTES
ncbi:hypothetical protein C2E23DRAFT_883498 [Lenzites betulinus]|nr:hypothetical protein C2E23DRAFT_883498 [Lenzites betulinus]